MSTESIEFFNIEWSNKYDGFNAIAAKDLKPGDVIIHEHQFAQQILSQFQGQMCEICYKEVKEGFVMKWCARCKQAFYCSKQCQIKHWNLIHKFECKVFEKAEPGLLMQTIRISFRVYLRTMNMIMNENKQKDQNSMEAKQFKVSKNILDRGKPTETQIENMNSSPLPRKHIHTSNDFLSLLSHLDKASHQNKIGLQFVSSRLLQLLGINPSSPARYYQNANAVVEASEIIAKVINNFENCTCKETQDHYIAIFPRLALINHSCYPNVKHTYCTDGSALAIATKEIKKGESLFVSYVGLKYPFSIRQKKLLHWHFSCDCERCIKNIEGQLILKEMEENKKKVGQDGQTISIYNDYKFPSDMYGDALVCSCKQPLFRVYNNPHEVTMNGNEDNLFQQFYYLCPKCLTPQFQSELEQEEINHQISRIEDYFQMYNQGNTIDNYCGKYLFHPLSSVTNSLLTKQFNEILDKDNKQALLIGYKLVENYECSQQGQLNNQLTYLYFQIGMIEKKLNNLPQAYNLFIKANNGLNVTFSQSDNPEMINMIEICNKQISEIKILCENSSIPLD